MSLFLIQKSSNLGGKEMRLTNEVKEHIRNRLSMLIPATVQDCKSSTELDERIVELANR
jgi:hypothetical protein